jgi:hypothetical protein
MESIFKDIYRRLLKRKFGWLLITVVLLLAGVYLFWNSLPEKSKEGIVAWFTKTPATNSVTKVAGRAVQDKREVRAYASSDGPRTDRKSVAIPDGWRYISHDSAEETRAGNTSYDTGLVRDPMTQLVREVWIEVRAEPRQPFGAGNWLGRILRVSIEKE